ncbi:hypothetical protein B0J13DRAFT_317502 [Dactylonectria estremocensis]|uniref:Zn(2)-C6 fungal-type domain-containing protein n=1 Tax=Dactylonectria estremocensis TaxID=1079267 RepID=A0A9P9EX58_9HYPO|nr:hypothetical protein B0J13DRAFT_317502 [Dactylonectria estremocensis]
MEHPAQHAAYGTACMNCARSKCRCIILNPGDTCERCQRLGKDCVQPGTKRKRDMTRSATSKNKQLEAKIDGLVSLLTSTAGSPVNPANSGTSADPTNAPVIQGIPELETQHVNVPMPIPFRPINESIQASTTSTAASLQTLDGSPVENEQELLHEFMALRLVHLPFMYIPSQTSAADMRTTRPFLWLCIRAVSTRPTLQQSKLYSYIRSIVGLSMVSNLERSIEGLLGLLVCIAWGNLQVHRRPFLTLFTQLAISIVFNLGLNVRPPSGLDERANYRFHKPWVSGSRTMEERRAVLGVYLLSSIVSCNLDRIDTLRWTPHMSECVHQLADIKECESDSILVTVVKLQLIVEQIRQSPLHERRVGRDAPPKPPAPFYVKALQAELDDVKRLVPSELQKSRVLLNYIHHA